jgi:hypothetical protein
MNDRVPVEGGSSRNLLDLVSFIFRLLRWPLAHRKTMPLQGGYSECKRCKPLMRNDIRDSVWSAQLHCSSHDCLFMSRKGQFVECLADLEPVLKPVLTQTVAPRLARTAWAKTLPSNTSFTLFKKIVDFCAHRFNQFRFIFKCIWYKLVEPAYGV